MGYSTSAAASDRLQAIEAYLLKNGGKGMKQSWTDPKTGESYSLEQTRKDQRDGAICGAVWKEVGEGMCRKAGTFNIDGDGKGFRGPAFLKKIPYAPRAEKPTFHVSMACSTVIFQRRTGSR